MRVRGLFPVLLEEKCISSLEEDLVYLASSLGRGQSP